MGIAGTPVEREQAVPRGCHLGWAAAPRRGAIAASTRQINGSFPRFLAKLAEAVQGICKLELVGLVVGLVPVAVACWC